MGMRRLLLLCALVVCIGGCKSQQNSAAPAAAPSAAAPIPVSALPKIETAPILEHIKVLASDEYEGRSPGTKGEELSVKYIQDQFKQLGLKPGNPDGTYVQKVPLVGITAKETAPLTVTKGSQKQTFKWADQVVAWSKHVADTASIDQSDIIFAGYGVEAPEFNWNDFKDVDVRGKTIMVLVNDPAVPDPADPSKLDAKVFHGNAMTYYGRWTYKFEEGARRGAAGIFVIHETGPAGTLLRRPGQPAGEVRPHDPRQEHGPRRDRRLDYDRRRQEDPCDGRPGLRRAEKAGGDARVQARRARPQGVAGHPNTLRTIDSQNVSRNSTAATRVSRTSTSSIRPTGITWASGSRSRGTRSTTGRSITRQAWQRCWRLRGRSRRSQPQPKRSILFLMVTAEEQGLLGSQYYSLNPLYPLDKTVANINIDGVNQWGRTKDLTVIGMGASDLDEYLERPRTSRDACCAPIRNRKKGSTTGRITSTSQSRECRRSIRRRGSTTSARARDYGKTKRDEYTKKDYHAPSDQIKPDWDLTGAVEDDELLFAVGYRVANADKMPEWNAGQRIQGEARRDR